MSGKPAMARNGRPSGLWPRGGRLLMSVALGLALFAPLAARAQDSESKPYDLQLFRLAEVLGAVHYLRELCGSDDGQLWRDRMRDIIAGEGASALRRARLTRSFNNGYRSYSRTYQTCTTTAKTAINRFLSEGAELSEAIDKSVPR